MAAILQEYAAEAAKLSGEGKHLEAANEYDKILELNPDLPEVHLNKGVSLFSGGEKEQALESFSRAVELKPELASGHYNKGNLLKQLGRHEEAVDAFREATEKDSKMINAWGALVHELNEVGSYEEALEAGTEGLSNCTEPNLQIHNGRILSFFKLNRTDEAIDDVEAILEQNPMDELNADQRQLYSMILNQKGSKLLSDGDSKNAHSYLERACEGDDTPQNLFPYGVCLIQLGKDDEAVPILEKAMAGDKENWKIPVALGTVYIKRKDYKQAADALEQALQHEEPSKDTTVNFNYAVALMKSGRDQEAKGPLEIVVSGEPDNWVALALLGTLYLQEEDYDNAVDTLEKAAKFDGGEKDSSLHYNLGYAKLMKDQPVEAMESFEKAVDIDPNSEQAQAAITALRPTVEEIKAKKEKRKSSVKSKDDLSQQAIDEVIKIAQHRGSGANPRFSERDMQRQVKDARSPLERVQAMLSPQKPAYLRRPSMEGIQFGFVNALAEVYDEITEENLKPSY